jgi:hypothetical protein
MMTTTELTRMLNTALELVMEVMAITLAISVMEVN